MYVFYILEPFFIGAFHNFFVFAILSPFFCIFSSVQDIACLLVVLIILKDAFWSLCFYIHISLHYSSLEASSDFIWIFKL